MVERLLTHWVSCVHTPPEHELPSSQELPAVQVATSPYHVASVEFNVAISSARSLLENLRKADKLCMASSGASTVLVPGWNTGVVQLPFESQVTGEVELPVHSQVPSAG